MDSRLPPELWSQIARQLPNRNLCRLCRVSKYLLPIIRRELYRSVTTLSRRNHYTTISLLVSEPILAGYIVSFRIATRRPPNILDALANMTGLDQLYIEDGALFETAADQERFVALVQSRTIPLTALAVSLAFFQNESFPLTGLTKLVWHAGICSQLWSVLEASRTILTDLTVPAYIYSAGTFQTGDQAFWSLKFPKLSRLRLQYRGNGDLPPSLQLSRDRIDFFNDHCPTVRFVEFMWDSDLVSLSFMGSGSSIMDGTQFPRLALRHLVGSVSVTSYWIKCYPIQTTENLEYLAIILGTEHIERSPISILQAALSVFFSGSSTLHSDFGDKDHSNFRALRMFNCKLFHSSHSNGLDWKKRVSFKTFRHFMEKCSGAFGAMLEVWRGLLPPIKDLDAKKLGSLLQRCFPRILSVDLSLPLIGHGSSSDEILSYVNEVASACPSLRAVFVPNSDSGTVDDDDLIRYDVNGGRGEPAIIGLYRPPPPLDFK